MSKKLVYLILISIISTSLTFTYLAFKSEFRVVHIISDSMDPTFNKGDLLLVRSIPSGELQVNQVAVLPALDSSEVLIAHRIINIKRSATGNLLVTTKGDANPIADDEQKVITSSTIPVSIGVLPISRAPGLVDNSKWIGTFLGLLSLTLITITLRHMLEKRGRYAKNQ